MVSPSSPTARLLVGLTVTLLTVAGFSWYTIRQIDSLRRLQTDTVDSNRRDSLQLLRIENNLNSLAMALRDMREGVEPYPLTAYKAQFDRIRYDLQDALRVESQVAPASRTSDQQTHLTNSMTQLWITADRIFAAAKEGREEEARQILRSSVHPQQAALSATVARLLVQNNAAEEQAVTQIQAIYDRVERNVYYFLAGTLIVILITSFYLIQKNRRIFENIAALSDQRRILAGKLITMQEEMFRSIARDLHDEFGQVLTAIGTMLTRAEKKGLPEDSPFRTELKDVKQILQECIEKLRGLSRILHPTVLDDYGLEKTLEWQVKLFQKQTGIEVLYEKQGIGPPVAEGAAIHVYRILQEALNNVARHSRSTTASVRLQLDDHRLQLEVQDQGVGLSADGKENGLGLIAMRERAELLGGELSVICPKQGGTLVSLTMPLARERLS